MTVDADSEEFAENSILLKTFSINGYTDDLLNAAKKRTTAPPIFDDHDPCDCRYLFTPQKLKRPQISAWLALQVLCLLMQVSLWGEMSLHLYDFNETIGRECTPLDDASVFDDDGEMKYSPVCIGRSFSMPYEGSFLAGASDFDERFDFAFNTTSNNPTFLLSVRVDPEDSRTRYHVDVRRNSDTYGFHRSYVSGNFAGVISDSQGFGKANWHRRSPPQSSPQSKEWTAQISDSVYMSRHSSTSAVNSGTNSGRTYRITVQEASSDQLLLAKKNKQCDFEGSWEAVNSVALGEENEQLSVLRAWVLYSIIITTLSIYAVVGWYGAKRIPLNLEFHWLVGLKWLIQDIPLQVVSLVYIFRWFNETGERCQLCLFDEKHCEQLSPFHLTNLLLIVTVLASSLVNQTLVKSIMKFKHEDEFYAVWAARIAIGSISILPFSTAMVAFNGSLLNSPTMMHAIFFVPCFVGWMSLLCLMCFPIAVIIDDSLDSTLYYI